MRHCKGCERDRFLKEFSKDKQRADGVAFYCKECQSKSNAALRKTWSESNNIPENLTCTICEVEKPSGEFPRDKSRPKGIRSECSPCRSAARNDAYHTTHNGWARVILDLARRRAFEKGVDFTLTTQDIVVPERCPVLGILLSIGRGGRHDASPTLDRIDPTGGYTAANVIVVSWRANRIKSDALPHELKAIAEFYAPLVTN